jgi:two-component system, cell cycle sensor histidine kinase and response regulator CckA
MNNDPADTVKQKILVVEDELIIAKGIERRLRALGYAVVDAVPSGEEAVSQARALRPDLVLMDICLHGGMDGVAAAEQIRAEMDIPIVFLTAYADPDSLDRAKGAEAFGYIVKPFQDFTLKSAVEMALYKHRMEMRLRRSERLLAIKNQIANIFLMETDDGMYGEVLQVIQEALASKYGLFGFINEEGHLRLPSMSRDVWAECRMHDKTIDFPRERWGGLWGRTLIEKTSFLANEGFSVPEGHVAIENFLTVPILFRGEVIGIVSVANKTGGYVESDRELLETIAERIAPILDARLQLERKERERRQAEASLAKSEKLLRSVFEAIPDLFSIIDRDHRIVLSNWHGGYSYVPQAVRSTNPHCFEAYYDRQSVCDACHVLAVFETGKPVFLEKFNEQIGYVEVRSFPLFDDTGNVALVAEHVRDITTRKVAEEELAAEKERLAVTLRSIGDGVITTDTQGRVVLVNKIAEELTGWTTNEAQGRQIEEVFAIINEKTRQRTQCPVARTLETGCIEELVNHTILLAKDGRELIIADSAAPIRDRESRIVGAVLVFRDITEKQKMEQELLRARQLESIGVLAGGIAHDFNNLLTAILGNISLSKLYVEDGSKVYQKLSDAEKATFRARDLTQQLLTFSRGGAPVKKTTSIADIIRDSVAFTLSGSHVTCRFDIAEDLWPVVIDEGQISQVVNNLILNAEQAMPAGGVITVRCQNTLVHGDDGLPLAEGRYILVSIRDQGGGIPADVLPRIFEPYFSTKETGKGLGLATVYSIIKNHDGHITVASVPGSGTTFSIYLPGTNGAEVAVPKVEAEAAAPEAAAQKGRVLIMDDEANIREVAGEMLQFMGYGSAFAKDGEEAVALYRAAMAGGEPFAAVLMDLTIPGGMGGGEALRHLLELDPQVRAIVSSGYSNDPILANYKSFGFSGIVTKPYKLTDLSKTLADVGL